MEDPLAAVFRSQRLEQVAGILLAVVGERERLDRLVHAPLRVQTAKPSSSRVSR